MIYSLYICAAFFVLVPISVGVSRFTRLNLQMKLLLLLFVIAVTVEGSTFYLARNGRNFYWVHHIYMPIEYGLLALIFSYWQRKPGMRQALRISIPIFFLICVWDIVVLNNLNELNVFTASIAFTLYVGMSAYTLLYLQFDNPYPILRDYRFWVSTALLIYSAGGLAYFSFHSEVVKGSMVEIWAIHAVLNIVAYILYTVGFIWQAR
jgi:hypothetical protein